MCKWFKKDILITCLVCAVAILSSFGAGVLYEHQRILNNYSLPKGEVTVEWAIERLARARESHRPGAEKGDQFDIDCMESYDAIANLIRGLAGRTR